MRKSKRVPSWAYNIDYEKEVKSHEFFSAIYENYQESMREDFIRILNEGKNAYTISTQGTKHDSFATCFNFCKGIVGKKELSEFEKFMLFIYQKEFIIPSFNSIIA